MLVGGGRQVYTTPPPSQVPPSSGEADSHKKVGFVGNLKLVLELEKTRPFAKSISAYNGMILLQLDDDHLETYKMNRSGSLVIQERLSVVCNRSEKVASVGTHLTLLGREGSRVFSKAMVEHSLCGMEDEPTASTIANGGSIFVASAAKQEILAFFHPFYHEKTLALLNDTIVDALVGLSNSIASLETKKTKDIYQQTLISASSAKEAEKEKLIASKQPSDVLGSLMNIDSRTAMRADDGPLKRLCLYSTFAVAGNGKVDMFDLDEFGNADRLESDGKVNLYLFTSTSTAKPLYHFNTSTKAFTLLPIPEDFLVLDLVAVPQSPNIYILIGKKRQAQSLLGVDSSGFSDFEEVRLIEASVRLTSKRFAEDERDNLATIADVMKAIRKLDGKMDRIEKLLLNLNLSRHA